MMASKHSEISIAVLLWAVFLLPPAQASNSSPIKQVVFILSDNQSYYEMSCHGHAQIRTPHIDALVQQGVEFSHFYAPPFCSPSRAVIMTGRHAMRSGVFDTIGGRSIMHRRERTLADILKQNGFHTAIFGKWHLGFSYPYRPQDRGFDEVFVHGGGGVGQLEDSYGNTLFDTTFIHNGKLTPTQGYCTDTLFDHAMDYIEKHQHESFFCFVSTPVTHSPHHGPKDLVASLASEGITGNLELFAEVMNLDENIGRLRRKLSDLDLDKNTLLIYASDQGMDDRGSPQGDNRLTLGHDPAHHVPCFMRLPNGQPTRCDRLAGMIDIFPTILDYCNIDVPAKSDGLSLMPLLTGQEAVWPVDRTLIIQCPRARVAEKWLNSSVKTERWRLVNGEFLYDIQADPRQETDVAVAHPQMVKQLRDEYEHYWQDLPNPETTLSRHLLGAPACPEVVLNGMDWYRGARPWDSRAYTRQENGAWPVTVVRDGHYTFECRLYPREANKPAGATLARLKIGDVVQKIRLAQEDPCARFTVDLEAGDYDLETFLSPENESPRGALFVYVSMEGQALESNIKAIRTGVYHKMMNMYAGPGSVARTHGFGGTINAAYDHIMAFKKTGKKEDALLAKAGMDGVTDVFVARKDEAVKTELVFGSRGKFFETYRILNDAGYVGAEDKKRMAMLLSTIDLMAERGPNNRAANYALGALEAVKTFPEHPLARQWQQYAEAVWNDWYIPGDTYEPSYVGSNLPLFIALGEALGKTEELKSRKLLTVYDRYRDQVSPSGLVVQPGDGEPYSQSHYVKALSSVYRHVKDPTILWALKKSFLAGDMKTGRKAEKAFAEAFPDYQDDPIAVPDTRSSVQYMFPETYKREDRMILTPSRKPGNAYAAFWLQDDSNFLYHGGVSDLRGDLYHYEVGGVLMLASRGRYDWPAWNNTFLVSEPDAEYPFRRTDGLHNGRWYRGSANLRVVRAFMPSKDYPREGGALIDKENPLGYVLANPDALAGRNDVLNLKEVEIQFALLPPEGESAEKIFPGRTWWGGYEGRNIAPSDKPVDIIIRDLFVAGAKGEKVLVPFDSITDKMIFGFIAPDESRTFPEVPLPSQNVTIMNDPETGQRVLKLTTHCGRTVLRLELDETFNLTSEYNRIGFWYRVLTPIKNWTRTPVYLEVNNKPQNNMKLDRQQGGILTSASTEDRHGDCYGEVAYRSIWTYGSTWKRRSILTNEGILIIRDEFMAGKEANGMVGGPVWHVPGSPRQGSFDRKLDRKRPSQTTNWFDASLIHDPAQTRAFTDKFNEASKNLMIVFDEGEGRVNGTQYQPKHWYAHDYAVYSKARLEAFEKEVFISVLIPHNPRLNAEDIADGIQTRTLDDRVSEIQLDVKNDYWPHQPLKIVFRPNGKWSVAR